MPSNDAILANSLRQVPSVIARAAIAGKGKGTATASQTPMITVGESPLAYLQSFASELANIPEIEAAARGHGYINDTRDRDGVVGSCRW